MRQNGVKHVTSSYHPRTNRLAERFIKRKRNEDTQQNNYDGEQPFHHDV